MAMLKSKRTVKLDDIHQSVIRQMLNEDPYKNTRQEGTPVPKEKKETNPHKFEEKAEKPPIPQRLKDKVGQVSFNLPRNYTKDSFNRLSASVGNLLSTKDTSSIKSKVMKFYGVSTVNVVNISTDDKELIISAKRTGDYSDNGISYLHGDTLIRIFRNEISHSDYIVFDIPVTFTQFDVFSMDVFFEGVVRANKVLYFKKGIHFITEEPGQRNDLQKLLENHHAIRYGYIRMDDMRLHDALLKVSGPPFFADRVISKRSII
mgnify:CR=1 FL=1